MLVMHLEESGFRVLAAATCREARDLGRLRPLHLVLLDYQLPDGNGLEALRDLRALRPDLPVIIMSGISDPRVAAGARAGGAAGFLAKPLRAADLDRTVREALSGSAGWMADQSGS